MDSRLAGGVVSTMTAEFVETRLSDEPGESAHIVSVPPHLKARGVTAHAYVMAARVEGFPIKAECGHTWIPQRDPGPLPVCLPCMEKYRGQIKDPSERDQKPDA